MRAHYARTLVDTSGSVETVSISVRLLQPGTTTLIAATVYADGSSGTILTNPWTITTGQLSFYLDQPQRVRIGITVGTGTEQYLDDVDVLVAASESTHAGTGVSSVQVGLSATATGDMSVAIGVAASATVGHSVAVGHQAAAAADAAVAVGEQALANQGGAMALGGSAQATGTQSTAVGASANAGHDSATAIGTGAHTTTSHQVMLGTTTDVVEVPGVLIVTSPNGSRYQVAISDSGVLSTVATPLPPTGG